MFCIHDKKILRTLERLHEEAGKESPVALKARAHSAFDTLDPSTLTHDYLAITPQQGASIYDMLCRQTALHIVEFGTSLGISTIYLAAAAKETGGKVITSEIVPEKCRIAQQHFEEAGVATYIEIREGDALTTLSDLPSGIDFLLMDGWKHLYLPLLQILEAKFKQGTIIYADNASFKDVQPYIDYLHAHPQSYTNTRIEDDGKEGSELSIFHTR